MVWDLGEAMRKKEAFESARLMDFEFRQRARATKLLAQFFGIDAAFLVDQIAIKNEKDVVGLVSETTGHENAEVASQYARCLAEAREQLIQERGDPTPYRLG